MLGPLDGLKVDPFLDQFPKRAHLSQLGDMPDSQLNCSVNLCWCGEAAQAKPAASHVK